MNRYGAVFLLIAGALFVLPVGCDKAESGRGAVVSWDEAAEHVGEAATVEGPVVGTHYAASSKGAPTFINVGKPYPDKGRFTVVIWQRNRGNFDEAPESAYDGASIRVSGTVTTYEGVPQIEVESPKQIEVVK